MAIKKSNGNMYPWVTHTHSHLEGKCPHACEYCYVQVLERRFKMNKYTGELRLNEDEFSVKYGTGRTIFVEHMNDLWAKEVNGNWIARVLAHCREFPDNTYVFQSKNPARFAEFFDYFPPSVMLLTTIETNRDIPGIGTAPSPERRMSAMKELRERISKM